MDHSTEHHSSPTSEKLAVFHAAGELIQEKLPTLLRRVLRDTSDHEQWDLDDKEKQKFLKLLDDKERIVVSSFMFQLKQNLDHFEKSGATHLRIVPRAETNKNQGLYSSFNESLMQRLSDIIGRPPIPLTENPVHLFNLKHFWNYAIDSLFLGDTERAILSKAFEQQFLPKLGVFYRALDRHLFKAGILSDIPVARLNLRNPDDYADTVNSSLGNIGEHFSQLIHEKRKEQAAAEEKSRKLEEMHLKIKSHLEENRSKLDNRQAYFFDNLWLPYLAAIALDEGTSSLAWENAINQMDLFYLSIQPCASRFEVRQMVESWEPARKAVQAVFDKLSATTHQKQVLSDFYERSFEHVLNGSVEQAAQSIRASRPLSAQSVICREAEEFKRLFEDFQMPASNEMLDQIAPLSPQQIQLPSSEELHEGDWAEMKQPRTKRKLMIKLAWKANDLSKYIFVDRSGKRVCELDHAAVAEKLDNGDISPINQVGMRAANQNLSTLRSLG